jgi:ubiquinone biosynthesis protein
VLIASIERLRALPRLVEIIRTLLHYGLHDFVHSSGLHRMLDETTDLLGWQGEEALATQPLTERARLALEALGPAFVKLGQVLASRVDLLGPEWIASLDQLHDHAAPLAYGAFEAQLAEDLGKPVEQAFLSFAREASAGGSIAQVHRAQLQDGTAVAVKIRRPGVAATIEADLLLLESLALWWEEEKPESRRYQPVELVRQLRKSLSREVDFAAEARSQERFGQAFSESAQVVIPRVHVSFTRASLLVMDWIDGVPGTDREAIDHAGLDRQVLAGRGADAVLKMVLVDGFFHADPHPGNVFFLPDNRLALIDFGMVGWLSTKRRDELVDLLAAVVDRDAEGMRDVLLGWADGRRVSAEQFAEDLGRLLYLYEHATLRELSLGTLLTEIAGIMREHHLVLPADLALLFKALITLEGLGTRLVPHFRLVEHVAPFVRRLLVQRWMPSAAAGRFGGAAREMGRALRAAPRLIEALARRFGDDGVAVRIEVREVAQFSRSLERSVDRLAVGLVTAALIVGSSILVAAAANTDSMLIKALGTLGILVSFFGGIWGVLSIRRSRRNRGQTP